MKSINKNAPVKCSMTINIKATKVKVWNVITNINNWENWQVDIKSPSIKGDLKPDSVFTWKLGGLKLQSILHTVEPFRYFGWTSKALGISAIHNWTISESKEDILVTVDESMEGFIARWFKKSMYKNLEKGMRRWLNMLKAECEK